MLSNENNQFFIGKLSILRRLPSLFFMYSILLFSQCAYVYAYTLTDPSGHFKFMVSHASLQPVAQFWRDSKIVYAVIGNISNLVNSSIDHYMQQISKETGISLERTGQPRIVMIYDSNVFDDLKHNPTKFITAGFPQAAIDELSRRAAGTNAEKCISYSWTDEEGGLIGGIVLSRISSDECVGQLLFDIFGVKAVSDDVSGFVYMCILYSAARDGARSSELIASRQRDEFEKCAPQMGN